MLTKYDFVSSEEKLRLAKTYKDGLWGLWNIDSKTEVVAPTWQKEPQFTRDHIIIGTPRGVGVIGNDGKFILESRFHSIHPQNKDRIIVKTIACFYGLFDGSGNELLPYIYQELIYETDECVIARQADLCGILDIKGNVRLPFEYEMISCSWPEKFIFAKKDDKWGAFTYELKQLIPFEFDEITSYNHFFIVSKGKYKGLYDYNGKELIAPNKYYYINPVTENLCIVAKDNKEGIIAIDGTVIVDCLYNDIDYNGEGRFSACNEFEKSRGKLEWRWSLLGCDGTILTEFKYNAIYDFVNGIAVVRQGSKYGCINKQGIEIVKPEWDNIIYEERDKYIKVGLRERTTKKWGLYDTEGNPVIPAIYDSIYVGEYSIDVEFNGKEGVVML